MDYEAQTAVLTFATGTTHATLSLGNLDDNVNEETESFSAQLSSPSSGISLGKNNIATVYIIDNDGKLCICYISLI